MKSKVKNPFKKKIQFASDEYINQVRRISCFTSYNSEELEAYWGTSQEFRLNKKELKDSVKKMHRQGRRMSDNMTNTRLGIKDKIGKGREEKQENRYYSRNAVLDEQDFQEAEGVYDDELMREVYQQNIGDASQKAYKEAKRLSDEIQRLSVEEKNE